MIGYYSIYDKKARTYGQLFPSNTPGTAERAFTDNVNNPDAMANKYPTDFALYHHGNFDDESGNIEIIYPPHLIVEATALLKPAV